MGEKRQTRAELAAALAAANELLAGKDSLLRQERAAAETVRKNADELKIRLSEAEADNQRLRGYIARVQEDDVVREELVRVGEPDGDYQLVPKRKMTPFSGPDPYSRCDVAATGMRHAERAPRRHWVTY
jgi:hypothetical protein